MEKLGNSIGDKSGRSKPALIVRRGDNPLAIALFQKQYARQTGLEPA